jgi:hypothetical protein
MIDLRMSREQDRLLAAFRLREDRSIAAGVETARQNATQEYLSSIQGRLSPLAMKRLDIELEIAALTADASPSNPSVAPDDTWKKLLRLKQAELAALGSPQSDIERTATQEIEAKVDAARLRILAQSATDISAFQSALTLRRHDVLARQETAMAREQRDLIDASTELSKDLRQPLAHERAPLDGGGRSPIALEHETRDVPPESAMLRLQAERARLVAQVLAVTRSSAMLAASKLHVRIGNWDAARPNKAIMVQLARSMSAEDMR